MSSKPHKFYIVEISRSTTNRKLSCMIMNIQTVLNYGHKSKSLPNGSQWKILLDKSSMKTTNYVLFTGV